MDNITAWLPTILTGLLVIAGMIGVTIKIKGASTELSHMFAAIAAAVADNKLTKEEVAQIVEEAKQVVAAIKTTPSK